MASYFQIPDRKSGYSSFLREFRAEIPLAIGKYDLEVRVSGNLPREIRGSLPIFGGNPAFPCDYHALNSGGRGILLSNGKNI
ncbi:hypothetical protein GF386_00595 [Candidatus Pacearchaeota archaeon]|nr:hypothetical protein [Candidatus Pacearchaeota archaeon]MBD3282753.1 hypothetical protein [Candidatus Pacearchaeota archaeon]